MYVTAEGLKLWVETAGPEDAATTVLLLHGFPDSHKLWESQISHLAAAAHRVIAPDLPGFGASDKPLGLEQYKMERIVQVLCSLLDQLKAPSKVVVVGHDWGAAVAWAMAFTVPVLQISQLAAAGHRVIAPDLPGFGASDKPAGLEQYKMQHVVQALCAMLDQLNAPGKVVVVGHDWGAAVAWALAFTVPDRVQKLAVLSVGSPGTVLCANPKQRELSWYMLFFQHPEAEELLAADDWALLRQFMSKNANEQEVQAYIDALSQPGALTAGIAWYRANLNLPALGATKPTLPPIKLDMQVMGVWSDREAYLTEEGMLASRDVVADGRWCYKRVEGAGHWMMRDAPDAVNQVLAEFVTAAS